ncbi:MAG: helix-turn-helix transcriptional regulator [Lachnospiraceae bacterium]|nr:helix-turn-helix transcriptional regulator [Lachnospiraceae bacterium]
MAQLIADFSKYKEKYRTRIRDLREDSDLTQEYIASVLGIRQNVYARYEVGAHDLPVRHLIALSLFYNVSTDYILGLSDIK